MPSSYSFDVVSEFDQQELVNAIDQLRREVDQRYDLKDSKTKIDIKEDELSIVSLSDMTIEAVKDILLQKATKRNLSLKIFDFQKIEIIGGNMVMQIVKLKKGLPQEISKKLSKLVRDNMKKVTVSIQGDSLRITGKNKDDLQSAINLIKKQEDDLEIALQFQNYR
ncbi:YajQ family cyclic di-GMP-binding protein [Prochlorococcus marinus]|uniref:YajQ family cyclic di-GMP-binding protein n=1 Tax=Prochlorococcus marinus TaxID=1219 RepID=UPI0022B37C8A|nr:YajQ family cyclic di-GMP-binding protein [Prochlorococcus marinus]